MKILKTQRVALGDRSYDIKIGQGLLGQVGKEVAQQVKGRQAMLVTDSNVGPLYAKRVLEGLENEGFAVATYKIPAGESSKSWDHANGILTMMLEKQFHRDACVIALGGGVVGDLAGFVAAIYQRGIAFIQVPTSLLSQVDSSVGGKVAVNHPLGKNMIGAFYQPKVVLIDMDALQTLEQQHWQNGLAEVVKYGVIYDSMFFSFLENHWEDLLNRDTELSAEMIAQCCKLKAEVVALDEKESGVRAKLNYGHTIGHGLELAGHYEGYLHGEGVALGMVLAARYAEKTGMCVGGTEKRISTLLQRFRLPITVDTTLEPAEILQGMMLDKKVEQGNLVFILPKNIGEVEIVKNVPKDDIAQLLADEFGR